MGAWARLLAVTMTMAACAGVMVFLDRLADAFYGETEPPRQETQLGLTRPATGLERLQSGARRGDAGAQYRLGVAYRDGHGVSVDYETAVFYFRQAAEQGDTQAQYSLAMRYYNGEGVTQNFAIAHKWFALAAEQGHERAQNGVEQALARMRVAEQAASSD